MDEIDILRIRVVLMIHSIVLGLSLGLNSITVAILLHLLKV